MALEGCITVSLKDEKGAIGGFTVCVPFTGDMPVDGLQYYAQQVADKAKAITKGALVGLTCSVSFPFPNGYRATPLSGSDVEEGGKFAFRTAGNYSTALRVPTLDESKVVANTRNLNTSDADVAAFIALIKDGVTFTPSILNLNQYELGAGDHRGDDIVTLDYAIEKFVSNRKIKSR